MRFGLKNVPDTFIEEMDNIIMDHRHLQQSLLWCLGTQLDLDDLRCFLLTVLFSTYQLRKIEQSFKKSFCLNLHGQVSPQPYLLALFSALSMNQVLHIITARKPWEKKNR